MIDVPVLVKDALREGNTKKNYRFDVLKTVEHTFIDDLATLDSSNSSYTLEHGCDTANKPILHAQSDGVARTLWGWVIWPSNARQPFPFQMYADNDSYMEITFGVMPQGTVITIDSIPAGVSIGVSDTYHVSKTEEYVTDFTIDNDTLVYESVKIDERMATGSELKFGLCEGSSLEFQYFFIDRGDYSATSVYKENDLTHYNNKVWRSKASDNSGNTPANNNYWTEWITSNINGRKIQAAIDVLYDEAHIDDVRILTTTGPNYRYKITEAGHYRVCISADQLEIANRVRVGHYIYSDEYYFEIFPDGHGEVDLPNLEEDYWVYLIAIKPNEAKYAFSMLQRVYEDQYCSIPMGFFDVKKCARQASTGIQKVTAYNKLQSNYLDEKANDSIIEIVEEGEVGISDAATIDTILIKLLGGYSIEPQFIKASYTVSNSWTIIGGYYSYYNTDSNHQIMVPTGSISIDISHINENGAYRFYINRAALRQALKEEMGAYAYVNVINPDYAASDSYYKLPDVIFTDENNTPSDMHPVHRPYIYISQTTGSIMARCYAAGEETDFYSDYVIKKYSTNTLGIECPMTFLYNSGTTVPTAQSMWQDLPQSTRDEILQKWTDFFSDENNFRIEVRNSNDFGSIEITTAEAEELPDVTLRDLQSAVYELSCQYGQLDRVTDLFSGVELNHSALYPADSLYPANDLYPGGVRESSFKSQYSKLWTDTGGEQSFRYLIITYKGLDEDQNEKDFTLQRTINANGTTDYNMSDNWLFRNLVWDAATVGDYADAMVAKMQNITWFPFEMWAAGLPYLETGDMIEINTAEGSYTSYVLQRQLSGIQNLQDTYINGELDVF